MIVDKIRPGAKPKPDEYKKKIVACPVYLIPSDIEALGGEPAIRQIVRLHIQSLLPVK